MSVRSDKNEGEEEDRSAIGPGKMHAHLAVHSQQIGQLKEDAEDREGRIREMDKRLSKLEGNWRILIFVGTAVSAFLTFFNESVVGFLNRE